MIKMIKRCLDCASKKPLFAGLIAISTLTTIWILPSITSYGSGENTYVYDTTGSIEEWWGAQDCDGTNGMPNYGTEFSVTVADDNSASVTYNTDTALCSGSMWDNMDGENLISKTMACSLDTHLAEIHLENNAGSFDTARVYWFRVEGNVLECGNTYSGLTVEAGGGGGGGNTINISGTAYDSEGAAALSGKTIRLSVNNTDTELTAETNASGEFSLSEVESNAGDIITLFLDDEEEKGVLVTKSNGEDITGNIIYQDTLNISQENGSAITNTDLDNADDGDGGADINDIDAIYYVMEGELVTQEGKNLTITSGKSYAPGGSVNVRGNFSTYGTFDGAANDITIGGNFTVQPSGTWNHTGGITMNGSSTQYLNQGSSAINSWFIIFNTASSVALSTNHLNVADLVINGFSTFNAAGKNVTVNTDFVNDGTFQLIGTETLSFTQDTDSGTFEYIGNGDGSEDTLNIIDFGATDYFNLTINSTEGVADVYQPTSTLNTSNLNVSAGTLDLNEQPINISSDLNIYEAGTLTATAATINIEGDWYNDGGGTFNANTSTVNLIGSGQNLYGSTQFYNLSKVDEANDSTPSNLNIEAESIQTIANQLTLDGLDDDDRVFLGSSNSGIRFTINFTDSSEFTGDYLSISDSAISDNSAGIELPVNPENSVDNENNAGWFTVIDETAPTLTTIEAVPSPSYNRTPTFTFQSNEAGNLTLSGPCLTNTSSSVAAGVDKTIIFSRDAAGSELELGVYEGCSITVTDENENTSEPLIINEFSIENQKSNAPTSTAPIVNYLNLELIDKNTVEISFSILDLDQSGLINARLEYYSAASPEWQEMEVKSIQSAASDQSIEIDNSNYYQINNINSVDSDEVKVLWDVSKMESSDINSVEVRITPFDGSLTGEYMINYTDLALSTMTSDDTRKSSSGDIILNADTPEENAASSGEYLLITEDEASHKEDSSKEELLETEEIFEATEVEKNDKDTSEEATEVEIELEESNTVEEPLIEIIRQKVETEFEKIAQNIEQSIINTDAIKSMVESVIINSKKTADEIKNQTPVTEKSLATVIIDRSITASETVDLIPEAAGLLTSKGPNLHQSDKALRIENILKYNPDRSLRFSDIGRFNPVFNKVQILKNSYLDILGKKQYVLNGDIQSFNADGTTKLKPKEAITRKNWIQMLMISHGLPAYSIDQLPEVRYDGTPMPNFNDLPRKRGEGNTADIIYSAAYYGLIEGTNEGNAEINRAVSVAEGIKMLVHIGEFTQGKNYTEVPQWVHINIPREGWFFPYYAKAAGQHLFGTILDNPDRLQSKLTTEEAADVLFGALIKRKMYQENLHEASNL